MKYFLFIISSCCLLLFSCKKDDKQAYSNDTGVRISSYKAPATEVQIAYTDQNLISSIVAKQYQQNTLPFPSASFSIATTRVEYVNATPVKLATNITMGDINVNTSSTLKWSGKGALQQIVNDNPSYQPVNWTADAQGRPTGYSDVGPGKKWTYDKNGNVVPENIPDGSSGTKTSTITFSNHKNPFNNGRIGLLLYMNASLQEPIDAVRYFSAQLPEKWEIIATRPITNIPGDLFPPATTFTSKTIFSYSYQFDGSGLLKGITEKILIEDRRDDLLVYQSETTNNYPVSSYRVR
jgi:YD repeat-containing protein